MAFSCKVLLTYNGDIQIVGNNILTDIIVIYHSKTGVISAQSYSNIGTERIFCCYFALFFGILITISNKDTHSCDTLILTGLFKLYKEKLIQMDTLASLGTQVIANLN